MRIPVLVESDSGNGFRARGGEPLTLSAEGTTRDEAIARLKHMIEDRLAVGVELISLDVESGGSSLAPAPEWSEDDPLLDEWQEAVESYRRQVEDDPDH
jgi:hypothetical protein